MAALDFPASPTTGQLFSAANGVIYRWDGTLWLVQAGPGGGTGDVTAYRAAAWTIPVAGSDTPIPFDTVLNGNSGGWYSIGTSRYTPPAGKYFMQASVTMQTVTNLAAGVALRKNGTRTATSYTQALAVSSGLMAPHTHGEIVDANGTDFFDWVVNVGGGTTWQGSWFSAFPLTGMQGPAGPAGPDSKLLQTVFTETGAVIVTSGSTGIPWDDTIPQITEGFEFMTCSITPKSATSRLIINVVFIAATTDANDNLMTACLFQDAGPNALAVAQESNASTVASTITFRHVMTSGTTAATTFRVRGGSNGAGITTFNGSAGLRKYGGVMASSIVIQEVTP